MTPFSTTNWHHFHRIKLSHPINLVNIDNEHRLQLGIFCGSLVYLDFYVECNAENNYDTPTKLGSASRALNLCKIPRE